MSTRKEELKEIITAAREELWEIESKETEKQNNKLLGKYYRYRNSYGSGERWWLYAKVIGVSGRDIRAVEFQICDGGKIEIEIDKWWHGPGGGWEEISEEMFLSGWGEIITAIDGYARQV